MSIISTPEGASGFNFTGTHPDREPESTGGNKSEAHRLCEEFLRNLDRGQGNAAMAKAIDLVHLVERRFGVNPDVI